MLVFWCLGLLVLLFVGVLVMVLVCFVCVVCAEVWGTWEWVKDWVRESSSVVVWCHLEPSWGWFGFED